MNTTHPNVSKKVTDYIDKLPEWSKAICTKLRTIILAADDSIAEEWKWGPHYSSNGMVCGYGAFQKHIKLTFFNGSGMQDSKGLFNHCIDNEFSRSIKYVSIDEIDEAVIKEYVAASIALNKKGYKRQVTDKNVVIPEDLQAALQLHEKADAFFTALSYGYKKEFVEHVTTAKQEATRKARIAKVVDHCAMGKKLNDKYK